MTEPSRLPLLTTDENSRKAFFDDFLQVQSKIENPKHDSNNPHFGSQYLSLEALLNYARPILNAHNFVLVQSLSPGLVSTYLMHKEGSLLYSESDMAEGLTPHQVVSYSTYMRRVQLTSMLGIRGEDDDDGNLATNGGLKQEQTNTPAPWMQSPPAPAPAPAATVPTAPPAAPPAPAPLQMPPPPPAAPAAPPAPAPVAAPPDGAIVGDMLAEAQNIMGAIEQTWGAGQKSNILSRLGIQDISHMRIESYAPFVEQVYQFVQSMGKSINLLGPEGGNQVLIQ